MGVSIYKFEVWIFENKDVNLSYLCYTLCEYKFRLLKYESQHTWDLNKGLKDPPNEVVASPSRLSFGEEYSKGNYIVINNPTLLILTMACSLLVSLKVLKVLDEEMGWN